MKLQTIRDVAEFQLCSGCGACAYADPQRISMVDDFRFGRRPVVNAGGPDAAHDPDALTVCPGVHLEHNPSDQPPGLIKDLQANWGPVLEVWEGHAADDALRKAGSSGGAASALALYGIEHGGLHGALHIAARQDAPYLNETVLSRTRAELLDRTGSRYAPASPCDNLDLIERAPAPCVFIGKPCDVGAVQKARRLRPELDRKLAVTIAFFCAGVPSTEGTLALMKSVGVDDPARVESLRYRGNGWPGLWTVRWRDKNDQPREEQLTYEQSWGFLTKYKQWRCNICPDHTGEFADIAVGDPWYHAPEPGAVGKSLIIPRTPRGLDYLRAAAEAGYVTLEKQDPTMLPASQPNLLKTRGAVWGRLATLRLLGVPTPRFLKLPMFAAWLKYLPFAEKLRSTIGTAKRMKRRALKKRQAVEPHRVESSSKSPEPVEAQC
jgi:coenzyme F420 hydrogenase subunit beta